MKQEQPVAFPPMRYIPEIHIPLRIPHRTVPATSRPFVRQPHAPLQPQPSSPRQQPNQVILTGVAGPPGYMQRVPYRRERGSQDLGKPVNGFAGAPGQRSHKFLQFTSAIFYIKPKKTNAYIFVLHLHSKLSSHKSSGV